MPCSDPVFLELSQLRVDLAAALQRHQEELQHQLKSWMSHQEVLAERAMACERRLEACVQKQSTLLAGVLSIGSQDTRPLRPPPPALPSEALLPSPADVPTLQELPGSPLQYTLELESTERSSVEDKLAGGPRSQGLTVFANDGEEVLRTTPRALQQQPRKKKTVKKVDQYLIEQKKAEVITKQSRLNRMTSSRAFEWTSVCLILVNALATGWQVQVMALDVQRGAEVWETSAHLFAIQCLLTVLFVAELGLRWTADGFVDFFRTDDVAWNIFDLFVVFTGVVETFVEALGEGSLLVSISVVRVLRVIRIVRVVRVIRVLPFFHELRLMIDSIIGSLKSFVWCMIVLAVIFYLFGLTMTTGVAFRVLSPRSEDEVGTDEAVHMAALKQHFGTVDKSMISLFMAMSGGRDWAEFYDVMTPLTWMHRVTFIGFISFALYAVVNVVIGVFVDSAIRTSGKDRDTVIRAELQHQTRCLHDMQEVFEEMDYDGTGTITLDEFERHLSDQRVIAYFATLKLDVSDARTLFRLLDLDNSGAVDINEFVEGCHRLKGDSRSLDIAVMRYELKWVRHVLQLMQDSITPLPFGLTGQGTPTDVVAESLEVKDL